MLPSEPFDGQKYIDFYGIEWLYSADKKCWMHNGKVDKIPIATASSTGLLPKEFKTLLDTIPPKGGGFGIIIKPLSKFRSQDNPDGILMGDFILRSKSLSIKCVGADGNEITKNSCITCFKETDEQPPGFDLNFSDAFLNSFCVEVPGGRGPRGVVGDKGDPGKDGTGDGPEGEQGDPGKDAVAHHTFTGVKIIDVDEIFDTAVVGLQLKSEDGKLVITKGKVKLPVSDETPAEELITKKIGRTISFDKCFDFVLGVAPCGLDEDAEGIDLDPIVVFYPAHFDPVGKTDTFQMIPRRFSDVVKLITKFYNDKLDEISAAYDKQIINFITDKDKEVRQALDGLVQELAECEKMNNIEYCIGINDSCEVQQ